MFDPERDDDAGTRPFYLRLLVVAVIAAAACAAMWPSVHGFSAGVDHDTNCVAIVDGWHHARAGATDADTAAFNAIYPAPPTPAQRNDPAAMARWHAQWEAAQASPVVQRAYDYGAWKQGPGACIDESRHRLILSAGGLGVLALIGVSVVFVIRTRIRALST